MQKWSFYQSYLFKDETFDVDKDFILKYYETHIKYHKKLYELFEDKYITWIDNIQIAYSMLYSTLKFIKSTTSPHFRLYTLYKDIEDKNFIIFLFQKTLANNKKFNELISCAANNWNLNRINNLDRIILQMGLCEFLYFPTIPPKVTMNEYIEISKIYSTEKSKFFINGILNQLFKTLNNEKKIVKVGKGLI